MHHPEGPPHLAPEGIHWMKGRDPGSAGGFPEPGEGDADKGPHLHPHQQPVCRLLPSVAQVIPTAPSWSSWSSPSQQARTPEPGLLLPCSA